MNLPEEILGGRVISRPVVLKGHTVFSVVGDDRSRKTIVLNKFEKRPNVFKGKMICLSGESLSREELEEKIGLRIQDPKCFLASKIF